MRCGGREDAEAIQPVLLWPLINSNRVDFILMAMRMSSLGNGLVIAGGAVGVATVAAIATGKEIVLTPAMVQLLIYKGLAAAAIGLIVVGSWLGRRGRQHDQAAKGANAGTRELEPGMPPLQHTVGTSSEPAVNTVRDTHSN